MEFCQDLWHPKTRVPGLSYGIVRLMMCLTILIKHQLMTDRRTDRQGHTIYYTSMVSHCKNTLSLFTKNVCDAGRTSLTH